MGKNMKTMLSVLLAIAIILTSTPTAVESEENEPAQREPVTLRLKARDNISWNNHNPWQSESVSINENSGPHTVRIENIGTSRIVSLALMEENGNFCTGSESNCSRNDCAFKDSPELHWSFYNAIIRYDSVIINNEFNALNSPAYASIFGEDYPFYTGFYALSELWNGWYEPSRLLTEVSTIRGGGNGDSFSLPGSPAPTINSIEVTFSIFGVDGVFCECGECEYCLFERCSECELCCWAFQWCTGECCDCTDDCPDNCPSCFRPCCWVCCKRFAECGKPCASCCICLERSEFCGDCAYCLRCWDCNEYPCICCEVCERTLCICCDICGLTCVCPLANSATAGIFDIGFNLAGNRIEFRTNEEIPANSVIVIDGYITSNSNMPLPNFANRIRAVVQDGYGSVWEEYYIDENNEVNLDNTIHSWYYHGYYYDNAIPVGSTLFFMVVDGYGEINITGEARYYIDVLGIDEEPPGVEEADDLSEPEPIEPEAVIIPIDITLSNVPEPCELCNESPCACPLNNCDCGNCNAPTAGKAGYILSGENATIFDALEILKSIVGMNSRINECSNALAAALIVEDRAVPNKPNIFDVLEILKYLVGMDSLVYQQQSNNY
ncbi:MAG: hypothetical protein FWH07_02190 [Oscillospiraceae bacterium]|nr:hypothetical protein [Oscillospiraceae bacterium]